MDPLLAHLKHLFLRHRHGKATTDEHREFMDIIRSGEYETEIRQWIAEEIDGSNEMDPDWSPLPMENANRIFTDILSQAPPPHRRHRIMTPGMWRLAAAASILALVAGIILLTSRPVSAPVRSIAMNPSGHHDLPPGKHAAILTLAGGQQIPLDSTTNGAVTRQGNTTVINTAGTLSYDKQKKDETAQPLLNTLTTNAGNQYQLVLPDGSHVWLNAGSSIRFPVAFGAGQRSVDISGEAYFEIAPDARHPFLVHHKNMIVQVLGTHFNVNTYADEQTIATTLLEGSIRIMEGPIARLIQPGQQLRLYPGGDLKIMDDVNTEEIIAWTREEFYFRSADIHSIMRQLSRWYNIKVEYMGNIQERFYARIPRNVPISEVLKALSMTGQVHFTTTENTVMVTP